MSAIHRRFTPRKKHNKNNIPIIVGSVVILGLLLCLYNKREAITSWFRPQIQQVVSNAEANARLDRLMDSLAGDRVTVLELARDYTARVGWIKDVKTRLRFEWILMNRLIEIGEWDEALKILPEVISIAQTPQIETLAEEAMEHGDYVLQLKLEDTIQKNLSDPTSKENIVYLLRSLQRSVATDLKLQNKNDVLKRITLLDKPAIQARIETQEQAAEAAALQLQRADLSEVKEPVYVQVKALLKTHNWPPCRATSLLLIQEVLSTLATESSLKPEALRDLASKMEHCIKSMLETGELSRSLPSCYMMLGDILYRLGDSAGCTKALSLAASFAEGFNELTPEVRLKIARIRSRALLAQNELAQAKEDLKYLAEKDTDPIEQIRALLQLCESAEGEERESLSLRCWEALEKAPASFENREARMAEIANDLADEFMTKQQYKSAAVWYERALKLSQSLYPNTTDGHVLKARFNIGKVHLKAKNDGLAAKQLLAVIRAVEAFNEAERDSFDKANPNLYKQAVRELSRAYLLMKERDLARQVIKKIGEALPNATR